MNMHQQILQKELKRFKSHLSSCSKDLIEQTDSDSLEIVDEAIGLCKVIYPIIQRRIISYEEDYKLLTEPNKVARMLAGIRMVVRSHPNSFMQKAIVSAFQLQQLSESFIVWGKHLQTYARLLDRVERDYRLYSNHCSNGYDIANKYLNDVEEDIRVNAYASLKTWSNEELQAFHTDFESFVSSSIEVFIEGPISLYVKLDKDTFVWVLRLLSQQKADSDLLFSDSDILLPSIIHDVVSDEYNDGIIDIIIQLLKDTCQSFTDEWLEDQTKLRSFVTTITSREQFIYAFEQGQYFKGDQQ